jgi:hypothetical protein
MKCRTPYRLIHDIRAVSRKAGPVSNLLGYAFCSLEYGVKIILLEQFGFAELQDVVMDVPPQQFGFEAAGALLRLAEGARLGDRLQLPILAHVETDKRKHFVYLAA